jgi:hypothetical protein
MKDKAFVFLETLFVLVFGYITLLAAGFCYGSIMGWPVIFFLLLFVGLVLLAIGLNFLMNKLNPNVYVLLSCIVIAALAMRLLWMLNVNTALSNDFKDYSEYAVAIAKGNAGHPSHFYEIFPFAVGYPLVLSVWYKIFGTTLVMGKVLNIVCSLVLLLLIYAVANLVFGRKTACIAGILVAFWPTQIMYTSVMATEHVFGVFFMLSVLLTLLIGNSIGQRRAHVFSLILGATITLAQLVRPMAFLLLPCILVYLFLFTELKDGLIKALVRKASIVAAVSASYLICISILNSAVFNITGVDLSTSSPGFNLLIGTNTEYGGMWNEDDAKLLDDFGQDAERIQKEAMRRGIARIKSDLVAFMKFALGEKMGNMWADEEYGYSWSTEVLINESRFTGFMENNSKLIEASYQVFYVLLLFMAVAGSIFAFVSKKNEISLMMLIALAVVSAHLFLEVQDRYSYPVMASLVVVAAFGVDRLTKYTTLVHDGIASLRSQ